LFSEGKTTVDVVIALDLPADQVPAIYRQYWDLKLEDMMVITEVPDILHSGHVHNIDVQNYRGTLIVNSGAWQTQTKYQQMMGIVPSPGIAIVVNLANLQPFQMNFNQPNPM
jgi:hypothetical protein